MFLSRTARSVTIVSRRTLEDSMSHYLIQQIRAQDNIKDLPNTVVHAVKGDGHLEGSCLENTKTGEREEFSCGRMFIFIGAEPRTEWFDGVVVRDADGFILTGPDLRASAPGPGSTAPATSRSSVPGMFVAGDVRHGSAKRVAAAVGEGSVAVQLVHRYLRTVGSPIVTIGAEFHRRGADAVLRVAERRATPPAVLAGEASRCANPGHCS